MLCKVFGNKRMCFAILSEQDGVCIATDYLWLYRFKRDGDVEKLHCSYHSRDLLWRL